MKLDSRYDTGGRFLRLVRFARQGHDKEWFQAHLDLEARATELHIWELQWVPGIVQTEDYIRAVVESAGTRVDMDAEIASRRQRQERLFGRESPPLTWIMLDQGVVETPVGGAAVQREQLAALLELAQRPYVTIRVMPRSVGAHVGRDGSFKIMTVGGADSAYVEACGGGRLVHDAVEVRGFRVRFERIGDRAYRIDESLDFIGHVMEGLG